MKDFIKRFLLTKQDYDHIKHLPIDQSKEIQTVLNETYNAHGEILTMKYIEDTRYLDEQMIDGINPGGIETAILTDPYRLKIFIPELPIHLKQYAKTKFSNKLGFDVSDRWMNYMNIALRDLHEKGAICFTEPVVIWYIFHFPKPGMDVDNYATKFINDPLRYGRIIDDDSFEYVSTFRNGILDMDKYGIEITVLSLADFLKYCAAII